jgi:hypothetical protein
MARPRFEVVDDPLAVTASDERQPEPAGAAPQEPAKEAPPAKPAGTAKRSRARAPGRLPTTPRKKAEDDPVRRPQLWDPPALDEPLTLVATRLPRSLDRALDEHTQQLRRARDGASQKKLPKQEVLAMAVWALGDPDHEDARTRLEAMYEEYRGRRLAAAGAAALASARAPFPDE